MPRSLGSTLLAFHKNCTEEYVKLSLALASLFMAPLIGAAHAETLFSIAPDLVNPNGDCSYNTKCGPISTGDTFIAQEFTLGSASTVTGAGWNADDDGGAHGTAVNYIFSTVDPVTGLPGSVIAEGNSLTSTTVGPNERIGATTDYSFSISTLSLGAGEYYLSIQDVTDNFNNFLSYGTGTSGAAITNNGGTTYSRYTLANSVAIDIFGTPASVTPEPGAIYLLGSGLAGIAALRRRFVRK
jgi:PEP-CTERM motif